MMTTSISCSDYIVHLTDETFDKTVL
jgi:hypothetical protein